MYNVQYILHYCFTADSRALSSDIFSKMQDFPPLEATVKNIGRNWWMWKKNFLSFLQKEDPKELYKDQWVTFFLMLIGPLGKQAYKDLSSRNAQRTKELKILLSDLDLYFIFGVKNKPTDENIDRYIDSLMLLDLHKITLFWKHCEELTAQTNAPKEVTINAQLGDARCIRCGTCHDRNNCPAHGMQCTNCKGYNHFTRNCKVNDVVGMASSSVSQEDFDNDFELTSRRSRIRTARARVGPPRTGDASSISFQKCTPDVEESQGAYDTSSNSVLPPEHENPQSKPIMRKQDKRVTGRVFSVVSCLHRPTHINKGKQQRDRRKLREKRRSTGVVHLPSTESTGGSTGEDEEELSGTCLETKHNTHHNEFLDHELIELIERAQEENKRLLSLLEDRDHKIMALEARLLKQQHEMAVERERLREENATLIRAMAALASN
ncbi:hypothetical protein DMN91_012246 [Ooceraea biroi]|uniref:CCHC-type domain-containing protein n=1 Tax=Ooceraea biroi TaxID=2015173 RepID=A0A3L8D423_OOCBI|nr:hypothetical protein DMN91_012246 [Ooceraea biroi]